MKTRLILQSLIFTIITGFALSATAQNKYNLSKKFTTEEKQKVNQVPSDKKYNVDYNLYEGQNDLEDRVEFKLTKIE